jgi:hypothetical protein
MYSQALPNIKQKNGNVKVFGRMSDGTGPLKKGKDMTSALSVSVAGLLDASTRLSAAASRISRQSTTGFSILAHSGSSNDASPAPTGRSVSAADLSEALPIGSSGAALYVPSYAEDIVAMKMASAAYKANAKMLKASSDMSKELIETLR